MKCKLNFTKGFALFIILMLAGGNLFAQSRTVQGTVTDAGGPVIGATVVVQGTSTGVTTGVDGSYSIRIPNDEAVLEFNFMGYQPTIIPVGDKSTIDVVLQEDTQMIDDVVVIGYGTVRRRDLTGSVASVNSKSIQAAPVTNVAQALQGKLAGVNVTAQDGRPDAEISIRVRGGGSISQSNEPLILIDGIPGTMNEIPADMVSSIDVLKDASSTAIYGANGANGVILITTKRPKDGKATVSYSGYVRFNEPTGYTDVMNPYEYLAFKWGLLDAYGTSAAQMTAYQKLYGIGEHTSGTSADGSTWNNPGGIDSYKNIPYYDLQKKAYNSSFSHNHDLSVSAGNDKTKVLFTVNYTDDEGMKINSYTKRSAASFKLDQRISNNLTFNLDLRYTERETMGSESTTNGSGSILSATYRFRPISMENMLGDINEINNGLFTGEDSNTMLDVWDPINRMKDRENVENRQNIRGTAGVNWTIIPGLSYRSELTLARSYIQNKNWTGPTASTNHMSSSGTHQEGTILFAGDADYRKRENWTLRWSNVLSYDMAFGDIHRLNVMVGHEVTNEGGTKELRIQADRFPANFTKENAFAMINQYGTNLRVSSPVSTPERVLSFFGRANYSLMDRYLLTFTMRADGSSNFSPDHRWGYFPAAALAWRLSDEEFMKSTKWVDDLKVRLSYGTVGNSTIEPSQWQQLWEAETANDRQYPLNNTLNPSYDLASSNMANLDLKWETTITRNFGIDFTLLNHNLWGSIDIYKNSTKDLLMLTDIPGITGFTNRYRNIGKTSNKGIEIALNGNIFQNQDWNITAGMNISFNKGNIDELAEGVTSTYGTQFLQSGIPNNDYTLVEGKPVGIVMGYKSVGKGFYTTDDFDYDASNGMYTLKAGIPDMVSDFVYTPGGVRASGQQAYPGAPKFQDTDNSGTVNSADIVEIGNMNPKHTGGFNINVNYKNFDLGLYFNWSYGNDVYNANKLGTLYNITKGGGLLGNKMDIVNNSYKYYDIQGGQLARVTDPTALNALNQNADLPSTYLQMGYVADIGIEDGSFLRLNTLTLGYTLPKALLNKAGISNLRVYGTIYNVFTLTGYSGLDPEVSAQANSNNARYPTPGLDWGAYPRSRQFVLGLNVTF